jgi:hypothetical protein
MQISALRKNVRARLIEFAWSQWTQLGVSGEVTRRDRWAADPEALLLTSLEIARSEPRLFDELLDWLVENGRLLSVQRLRNLYLDDDDLRLGEAALAWAALNSPLLRFLPRAPKKGTYEEELLFRTSTRRPRDMDRTFRDFGFVKAVTRPSHKSRPPDPSLSIAFAFRLRQLFGSGSRAEVVRFLLTTPAQDVPAQLVADSAAFAKRNVYDSLESFVAAGVASAFSRGGERRYGVDKARWAALFGLATDDLPLHRDWPQLLGAIRVLIRFLEREDLGELSEYMLASEARLLVEQLQDRLLFAGVPMSDTRAAGADYWPVFVETVESILGVVETGRS